MYTFHHGMYTVLYGMYTTSESMYSIQSLMYFVQASDLRKRCPSHRIRLAIAYTPSRPVYIP